MDLPSDLFPSGFPTKTPHTPLLFFIHATCPSQLILLDSVTRTMLGAEYRSLSSSLYSCYAYTFKKTGRTLIWGSYKLQHEGNIKSLVTSDKTEFKILIFGPTAK
jgi:hypothetical protein